MQHTLVDEQDFGVAVRNLKKIDLFEVPVELVDKRPEKPVRTAKPRMEGFKEKSNVAAKEAVVAEAEGTDITFEFDGESYTAASLMDTDLDVLALMDTDPLKAVQTILGPDQWGKFKPEGKKRTMRDLLNLITTLTAAQGVQPGE